MEQNATRSLVTHTTPEGKTVVMLAYLTARERRDARSYVLELSKKEKANNDSGVVDRSLDELEDYYIKLFVREYDGSSEGILERIVESPSQEMDFIMGKIRDTNNKENDPKKPQTT